MDTTHCHYHGNQQALWQCVTCQRAFGGCCIPLNADDPVEYPPCPLCRGQLKLIAKAQPVEAFTENLGQCFLIGLQRGPLTMMGMLFLGGLIFSYSSSFIVGLVILALMLRYLQSVLQATSQGLHKAPAFRQGMADGGFGIFFRFVMLSIPVIFILVVSSIKPDTPALREVLMWLLTLLMPALIIRIALVEDYQASISVAGVLEVMRGLGWRYLVLCLLVYALWLNYQLVANFIDLPMKQLVPALLVVLGYYCVVIFALLGFAVFQIESSGEAGSAALVDSFAYPQAEWLTKRALADSEVRLKEGQGPSAIEILTLALENNPDDLRLNERFHHLLFALKMQDRCVRHLSHYLPLAAQHNPQLAANALLNVWKIQAEYLPDDPTVCERAAQVLLTRHKAREALLLLNRFPQRFPDYPFLARACLMAARSYAEALGQTKPARELLNYLRGRQPNPALVAEIASMEQVLDRIEQLKPS